MTVEYMFVVFARERYRTVTCDGTVVRSQKANGADALSDYFERLVWPDLEPRLNEAAAGWDEQKRVFVDRTRVTVSERKSGSIGNRVTTQIATITWPDGRSVEHPAHDTDGLITNEYVTRYGKRPNPVRAGAYNDWLQRTGATSEEKRGWTMTSYLADGTSRDEDIDLGDWRHGAPYPAITKIVNDLARHGWTVANMAEDKGLYNGADANLESYPARLRLMFSRPAA